MIRRAGFFIAVKLSWLKRPILGEVAGSSPATATKFFPLRILIRECCMSASVRHRAELNCKQLSFRLSPKIRTDAESWVRPAAPTFSNAQTKEQPTKIKMQQL